MFFPHFFYSIFFRFQIKTEMEDKIFSGTDFKKPSQKARNACEIRNIQKKQNDGEKIFGKNEIDKEETPKREKCGNEEEIGEIGEIGESGENGENGENEKNKKREKREKREKYVEPEIMVVSLASTIAGGKSTVLDMLKTKHKMRTIGGKPRSASEESSGEGLVSTDEQTSQKLGYTIVLAPEPVGAWTADDTGVNWLSLFYSDKHRYSFSFQIRVLDSQLAAMDQVLSWARRTFVSPPESGLDGNPKKEKTEKTEKTRKTEKNGKKRVIVVLTERSPIDGWHIFSSQLHDAGFLPAHEYRLLKSVFSRAWHPDAVVWVSARSDDCMTRIHARSRASELSASDEPYFRSIAERYETLFSSSSFSSSASSYSTCSSPSLKTAVCSETKDNLEIENIPKEKEKQGRTTANRVTKVIRVERSDGNGVDVPVYHLDNSVDGLEALKKEVDLLDQWISDFVFARFH